MYKNSLKAFGLLIFTFIMKKLCHIIYKLFPIFIRIRNRNNADVLDRNLTNLLTKEIGAPIFII